MRRGMNSLAVLVQEAFKRDPHGGDLYVFPGKSGKLIKILWHDGLGMSLYAKRLERGRFLWPSPADGVVLPTGFNLRQGQGGANEAVLAMLVTSARSTRFLNSSRR
jgi:transposase